MKFQVTLFIAVFLNFIATFAANAQHESGTKGFAPVLYEKTIRYETHGIFLSEGASNLIVKGVVKEAEESALKKCQNAGASECSVMNSMPMYISYNKTGITCEARAVASGNLAQGI